MTDDVVPLFKYVIILEHVRGSQSQFVNKPLIIWKYIFLIREYEIEMRKFVFKMTIF